MFETPLNVVFPVALLKPNISLLDPENTETVWEYYLLENLSCGLIRDSQSSADGYDGCIAERFYQESPSTWVFHLRQLIWSDGTEVSLTEIKSWISNFRSNPHRHIRFLKLVKTVEYDETSGILRLTFQFPMDNSILHELSLADSGLMPISYKTKGWGRTVGPFKVESWEPSQGVLKLSANSFSPLFRNEMPQSVTLQNVKSVEEKAQLFSKISMDIVPATALTDPKLLAIFKETSSQQVDAHPSSILFLHFNYLNPDAKVLDFRLKIMKAIQRIRPQIELLSSKDFPLHAETQMVPLGFSGRLTSSHSSSHAIEIGLDYQNQIKKASDDVLQFIKIRLPEGLRVYPDLVSAFSRCLLEGGFQVSFDFNDNSNQPVDEIGRVYGFVGNQLDSSGSWSFLLAPPKGPLSPWLPELKDVFDQVFAANNWAKRREASEALHQTLLENAIAIPLLVGQHRYFLSARVDASRWNPLDSRLRLYELGWR